MVDYKVKSFPSGVSNGNARHTQTEIDQIREKYAGGDYTFRTLAREYGYKSHKSIISIVRGEAFPERKI